MEQSMKAIGLRIDHKELVPLHLLIKANSWVNTNKWTLIYSGLESLSKSLLNPKV